MLRNLVCELCSSSFECGAPGVCWCSGVKLGNDARGTLGSLAGDCVCRDCMEKAGTRL